MLSLTSRLSSSFQDEAGQGESDSQGLGQSKERSAFTIGTVNTGRKLGRLFQHCEQLQDLSKHNNNTTIMQKHRWLHPSMFHTRVSCSDWEARAFPSMQCVRSGMSPGQFPVSRSPYLCVFKSTESSADSALHSCNWIRID